MGARTVSQQQQLSKGCGLPVLSLHTERIKGILLYNCLSEKAMETREMLRAMLATANRAVILVLR